MQQRERQEEQQAAASEQLMQAAESGQSPSVQHRNPLDRIDSSRLDVEMAAAASSMRLDSQPEKRSGLFGRRKAKAAVQETRSPRGSASKSRPFDCDLVDVSSYSDWSKDGYKPVLTLTLAGQSARTPRVTALSVSEAGFLAAAWGEKLAIADLRGPEVLLSEAERVDVDEAIVSLVWTVCAQGDSMILVCRRLNDLLTFPM